MVVEDLPSVWHGNWFRVGSVVTQGKKAVDLQVAVSIDIGMRHKGVASDRMHFLLDVLPAAFNQNGRSVGSDPELIFLSGAPVGDLLIQTSGPHVV